MDLNESHKHQLQRYQHFFKGKRERLLKDRDADNREFIGDRIDNDAVYNGKEVEDLLQQYHAQLIGALRQELAQIIDFTAVYTSQILSQAQQYGMTLDGVDINMVEDQNRVNALHAMDSSIAPPMPAQRPTLAALQPTGAPDLLMTQKMQDLEEENRQLQARYQKMQSESTTLLHERSGLQAELEKIKTNFDVFRQQVNQAGLDSSSSANVQEIEASLASSHNALQARNAEIARMKQEQEARIADSSQFRELKAIVKKKSDEVKLLRRAMQQHGLPLPQAEGGVELVADDD